jgi:hypothetical protein
MTLSKGATVEANTSTAVLNATRNLPTVLTGEVERLGYTMLRALDRMGFVHETQRGDLFTVRFEGVNLYGATWAAYTIDAERLYHFSIDDLSKPRVLSQLSAATKKPVRAYTQGGLAYVVEMKTKPRVRLPDVALLDLAARPAGGDLPVPVGIGRDGATWRELRDVGHSLIAGTTGAGKSTFLHSALAALLSAAGPDRLRLALIDPKRSEFTAWRGVPHLRADIANTPAQAADLLRELAVVVDERGDLLAGERVRDIGAYNRKAAQPLPYVLAMIDECLDLADEKRVTEPLKTIARRGRSAGVILWCATQHAAAIEGLPRVVNVNLTTRFVFRVADDSAARVAGAPGAENLPRNKPGRMLAKIDGAPLELQAFTVGDDNDLADVVRSIRGDAGQELKASGPILSGAELELVRFAVLNLGGFFPVNRLARDAAGWTNHKVNTLAQRLERAGLLEKGDDPRDARRVSAELAQLAGAELTR